MGFGCGRVRLGGNFGWRFGLRFQHWFESWRALAELAGRHGIDAMGGRSVLRLVLHLNLRGCFRLDSHSRLRRGNCLRLWHRRTRQSGFGRLGNLRDVGFRYSLLIEFLNNLCGGRGGLEALLKDGGSGRGVGNGSVVAAVASALSAGIAVIAVGSAIASRPPLKVARTPVASLP
jgi:outer membrane lipoprotein SlyB